MRGRRQRQRKKSKNGDTYRSNFELLASNYFDAKKVSYDYEKGHLVYTLKYIPDYTIYNNTYKQNTIIETKGFFPSTDRVKMASVKRNNPDVDIRFVFMRDNKLSKKSLTRYSDWATKNGFPCHVVGDTAKFIPDSWLKEFKGKPISAKSRISKSTKVI